MNIVLTGPMGSGKTMIGKKIAENIGMAFIDSDTEIVNKKNQSITEIFTHYGEQYFRQIEEEIIEEISTKDNVVIATGGGVVLSSKNMRNLRRNGLIIHLHASVDTLKNRLQHVKHSRPLLQNDDSLDALRLYSEGRMEFYNNNDFCIPTDNLSINQIVTKIIDVIALPRIRICASIAGDNPEDQIRKASMLGASIIELRFDLLDSPNIESLIQMSRLPVIATDRKNNENLLRAIDAGCEYIDIDSSNPEKNHIIQYAQNKQCKIIQSMHDYNTTPPSFKIDDLKGDYIKIATTINSFDDSQRLLNLLQKRNNLIIIGMGDKGLYVRVISPLLGSFLTYASIDKKTAPGQITVEEMVTIYKKMGLR